MSTRADDIFASAQDHHASGRLDQAIELYRRAIGLNPVLADGHFFLGLAEFQAGHLSDAETSVRRAIEIGPAICEYYADLATILFARGDMAGSESAAREALKLQEGFPPALFTLGNALCCRNWFDEGIEAYEKAVAGAGPDAAALNNLGMAHLTIGEIDRALVYFDRILAADSKDAAALSNRIYAMYFDPASTTEAIDEQLRKWNQRHVRPLSRSSRAFANSREKDRRLRVGYVSPDFREHVVGWNIAPLLREHDNEKFEIFCYSSVKLPDAMTRHLQSLPLKWRDISGAGDDAAADSIRADRIDILVDLSLHTSGNRLKIFARKPAPIQVTWLGYPGSTGLETIDYRLSDPYLDEEPELFFVTEQTLQLPATYWCYAPGGTAPPVSALPGIQNGFVTFGCLNQFLKVSNEALRLWARILKQIDRSRLLLHAPEGRARQRVAELFSGEGIEEDRIRFVPRVKWLDYMRMYLEVDVALDPFPFGGGITSCDALWMGVPPITMRGKLATGRGTTSILSNMGLQRLIASNAEEYLNIAVRLARSPEELRELRRTLRVRMNESALMKYDQFARAVEAIYRNAWCRWITSSA